MARVLVTVRVPASLWHLFRLALLRERISMQKWVHRAVSQALQDGRDKKRARSERPRWGDKGAWFPDQTRGPVRQVVARLESGQLDALRSLYETKGIREWLLSEIEGYVERQRIFGIEVLGANVLSRLRDFLPANHLLRERIARVLTAWPDEVVREALVYRPYGLREVIRAGDLDLIAEILEVANMRRQLREKSADVERRATALRRRK